MRAERLLEMIALLQAHRQLTAGEIAARMRVSVRTVQRDLMTISGMGVPIYAIRGGTGGWALPADYRSSSPALSPAEALTVFAGQTSRLLADLGLQSVADAAWLKLLAALPASVRAAAQQAHEWILIDHTSWRGVEQAAATTLPVLQRGLWERRWIRITYGARATPFLIAPLGLVAKASTWYVVAQRDGAPRTYRTSRIRTAEWTSEEFERPVDFHLAEHWERSSAQFIADIARFDVRLRVRSAAAHRLAWAPGVQITESVAQADGWSDVAMTFENEFEALAALLGMAGDAIVVEPSTLRTAMRDAARSIVTSHE
jgi:predicted DNA-binding transcriptional regulator YafY